MCYQILRYKPSSTAMSILPSGDKLILEIFLWFSNGRVHDLLLIEKKEMEVVIFYVNLALCGVATKLQALHISYISLVHQIEE